MTSTEARRALIIGGSMAGLFAGLHLLKIGWRVDIYERADTELASRGAGIVTHPPLFEAMKATGIDAGDTVGVEVSRRVTFDHSGAVLGSCEKNQILTSWGRLYQVLKQSFPAAHYHTNCQFLRAESAHSGIAAPPDQKKISAFFSDGSKETGDLLIAADGFRSGIREHCEPQCQPLYAGYVVWRGLVPESVLSRRALEELFPYFAFTLPHGEQMLGYPVAGNSNSTRVGERCYNVVWYRPADVQQRLPWIMTDTSGRTNLYSIAPNAMRSEVISEMRADAQRLASPQFAELFAKLEQPFVQPIYDLTVESMVHDRTVIIGDAAFVVRPHVGMGVTKAAEDAVALARSLKRHAVIEDALHAFNNERHPLGRFVVQRARHLGAYMQAQLKTDEERARAEEFRTPEAVMRETATADFLANYPAT